VVLTILGHLAHFHATFWQDPGLDDPDAGLMGGREALLLLSPSWLADRLADGDTADYLRTALLGWEAFFQLAAPDDAATLERVARQPERVLAATSALPRTLVHGDVWEPNLGLLPATRRAPRKGRRLLLLDFALATAGPSTYDALWLPGTWHALDPVRVLAAYRLRLERVLRARGHRISTATWTSLADAGYLRTTLTCGEALARTAQEAPAGAGQRRLLARVRWWAARAAAAALRLESGRAAPPGTT
jgi:Phosphotransferase enzyme family